MKIIGLFLFSLLALSILPAAENISLRQTSENGLSGWTLATSKNYQGAWMNSHLVVRGKDGKKTEFEACYPFIEKWGFVEDDSSVVIRSIGAHGPYSWEKFDLKSGKLVEDYYRNKDHDHIPSWVMPFLNKN